MNTETAAVEIKKPPIFRTLIGDLDVGLNDISVITSL
jgi:hypothetical protein